MTNTELYGKEPKLSTKIQHHRLRLAGHSYRSTKEPVSQLITWSPKHGRRNRGRQRLSYTDVVARDIGVLPADLPNLMRDRQGWASLNMIPIYVD